MMPYTKTTNNSKRLSLLEIFGKILLNPRETFGYIIARSSGLEETFIFSIYVLSAFAKYAMIFLVAHQISGISDLLAAHSINFTVFSLGGTILAFISLFIFAGISHFLAKSARGVGEPREIVTLFTFFSVANTVVILGAAIALALPTPFDIGVLVFSIIIYLVWKAFLAMLAVEEVYGINQSEAFIAGVVAPLLLGVFLW